MSNIEGKVVVITGAPAAGSARPPPGFFPRKERASFSARGAPIA
jgi:hypothetical protein